MSPVKAVGKKIVNVRTGKVEGTASSHKNAEISASIRNRAHAKKKGRK